MFELRICGYPDLGDAITNFLPSHIISAIRHIDPLPGRHLHVAVDDIASPMPTMGYALPQMDGVDQVFEFTKELSDDDRLLIHCFAGQSRSTAFAIGVLIQHGMTPDEAFAHVAWLRPCLLPNQRIIHLIDQRLKLNGVLEKIINDYRAGFLADRIRPPTAPTKTDVDWMKQLMQSIR